MEGDRAGCCEGHGSGPKWGRGQRGDPKVGPRPHSPAGIQRLQLGSGTPEGGRPPPPAAGRCSIVWNTNWKLIHTANGPPGTPTPPQRRAPR